MISATRSVESLVVVVVVVSSAALISLSHLIPPTQIRPLITSHSIDVALLRKILHAIPIPLLEVPPWILLMLI
jgi:hypothetical protein